MAKHFYLNITDDQGVLIDRLCIDGMDLRKPQDQRYLGERVESAMGGNHVAECADLPDVDWV